MQHNVSKRLVWLFLVFSLVGAFAPLAFAENTPDNSPFHEVQRLHTQGYINAIAWNADGSRLAALSKSGNVITLWNTKDWTKIKEGAGLNNCS